MSRSFGRSYQTYFVFLHLVPEDVVSRFLRTLRL